ncbi:hypothetical protein [Gulosibacter chungangensis]|uniref:Uncharacterized protein n=1 Tax=Gulosibacter chungangensis TaxID=979746 RepID=A0A7J5BB29_9MICO|nr:hypothetical protein [Gulosibacter chungangensis]KAB1643243.1 hypothetical protein F8O05_08480 [Gulosibacter chungangensis]
MSHTGDYANEPYDDGQPTKAYHYRDAESPNKSKFDWQRSSGGEAPTDEIDLPQEPSDRTRVMPMAEQEAKTAVYSPVPQQQQRAAEAKTTPSFQEVTYQPQQPVQYVQQPTFTPHPSDLRKGASAGARVSSVIVNLVLTALIFLLLWDYRGINTFNSVVLIWFTDLNLGLNPMLAYSLIPIMIGILGLLSGLTLWLSATGTGVFGVLMFVFSVVAVGVQGIVGGEFSKFLGFALPLLFPTSLLMMGAAFGAGFARRAGARKMIRAYTGRL